MSSSRPADLKQGLSRRPWSLRRRLIMQLAGLLALVCLIVGVLTEFALRDFLIGQLDDRLAAANERGNHSLPSDWPRKNPAVPLPPDLLRVPGQGVGTLGMRIEPNGTVLAGVLKATSATSAGDPFPYDPVPAAQLALLKTLPPNGIKQTKELGPLGEYRLVASRTP